MATRIITSDITDKLIKPIVDKNHVYLSRADDELNALAKKKGLLVTDIANPISYSVKEWMISSIGRMVCQDESGVNPQKMFEQGVEDDPYEIKLKYYNSRSRELKGGITSEMIKDTADSPEEFASAPFELYRG